MIVRLLLLLLCLPLLCNPFAVLLPNSCQRVGREPQPLLALQSLPDDFAFNTEPYSSSANQYIKNVTMLSDSTGVSAKLILERALSQFDSCGLLEAQEVDVQCEVKTRIFSHVTTEQKIATIIKVAKSQNALVIYTLSDPELRAKAARMCELSDTIGVDLMGPLLDGLSDFLKTSPSGTPVFARPRIALSDSYYNRIEAVEFTLKADDGAAPWLLKDADVVLVGVSRTGKTPLSVVLAQTMGLKVANVPLCYPVPPPVELTNGELDPKKVFSLTINPNELKRIRMSRLERSGVDKIQAAVAKSGGGGETTMKSDYADRDYMLKDLKAARDLAADNGWLMVDVTGRAVEETASYIDSKLKEGRADENLSKNLGAWTAVGPKSRTPI